MPSLDEVRRAIGVLDKAGLLRKSTAPPRANGKATKKRRRRGRITEDMLATAEAMHEDGKTWAAIGRKLGVSATGISAHFD